MAVKRNGFHQLVKNVQSRISTWNLVVVVGTYDGPCGCQSGTVKTEPVPFGKLLRKCKTYWR